MKVKGLVLGCESLHAIFDVDNNTSEKEAVGSGGGSLYGHGRLQLILESMTVKNGGSNGKKSRSRVFFCRKTRAVSRAKPKCKKLGFLHKSKKQI